MRIAVWNLPPVDLLAAGFSIGENRDQFELLRLSAPDCERVLREGHVDAALLPTLTILQHNKDFDVVPAVAFSTWSYPFARLAVGHGLDEKIDDVAYNPDFEQERFVAEVVLREHYRLEPDFARFPDASNRELLDTDVDARLLVGADVPTMTLEGRILDLGEEWFELANYPMTWGLFAAEKGSLTPPMVRRIRDAVRLSERRRDVWIRAQETSEDLYEFYVNGLRFRLDDLCIAGLTEFRQYLFFYDVVDDVRDVPFVYLPSAEEGNEGRKPLL